MKKINIYDYLNEHYANIEFTSNHVLQNKQEWVMLRNMIDLDVMSLLIFKLDDVIYSIEVLIMLGYNCIAVDVLNKNEYLLKLSCKTLSMDCMEHLRAEYDSDMNVQSLYDHFVQTSVIKK